MTRHVTMMTLWDADHFTEEERQARLMKYPAHERDARAKGIPMLGSGRIFPLPDEAVAETAFPIPRHWPIIGGLDFGWDHPTAAVRMAWDRDADVVHVTHTYKVREATPVIHSAALRPWGKIPWAWPHDGHNDTAAGENLAQQYRAQSLDMLAEHARYEMTPDRKKVGSVEAGLMDMLDRMQTGRLKVADHLGDWFEEFRLYHRQDGKVVKQFDDLMSATRYGGMSLRFARTVGMERPRTGRRRGSAGWMAA